MGTSASRLAVAVGAAVHEYRLRHDLDLDGLADNLGVDVQDMVLLEGGVVEPTGRRLHRLVSAGVLIGAPTVRCEHTATDGRLGGWHHHEGPHACDSRINHQGHCPWEESMLAQIREAAMHGSSSLLLR